MDVKGRSSGRLGLRAARMGRNRRTYLARDVGFIVQEIDCPVTCTASEKLEYELMSSL
jgi:hypothetical protein